MRAFEGEMKSFLQKAYRLLQFPRGLVLVAFVTTISFLPVVAGKAAGTGKPEPQRVSPPPPSPVV
jgi:peptidoglycan biosynthesis protein MviN/MurJ (putative lipid II flippase)